MLSCAFVCARLHCRGTLRTWSLGHTYLSTENCSEQRAEQVSECEESLIAALEDVDQLNEDRTIRRYIELIKATLRTNFYQLDDEGKSKSYLSFKINPHAVSDMPLPRPMYEIFVYSPRVEGVHLRGGPVARGGQRRHRR